MELDKLRKIAEDEETQKWGGWALEEDDWDGYCVYINDGGFGRSYVAEKMSQGESDGKSTAKFIATFDPPTVLDLLSRLEQAEQQVARVREFSRTMLVPHGQGVVVAARVKEALDRALDGDGRG